MPRTALTIACLALVFALPGLTEAGAKDCGPLYTYRATITDIYDGDTVTADVDLGFHTWRRNERLRLFDIDAPELKNDEKPAGLRARDALRRKILSKDVTLCTFKDKQGKYGRYLATIYLDDININDWLVSNGYAAYRNY